MRLRRTPVSQPDEVDSNVGSRPLKRRVLDIAVEHTRAQTMADLGGIWAINGGYTLRALQQDHVERAVIVDNLVAGVADLQKDESRLELIEGNFADPAMPANVGHVDLVLLFDVLLHQAAPDWNEVLSMWAPHADAIAITNPMWLEGTDTVRLLELGHERYREVVPPAPNVDDVLGRLDELHPGYGKPYRDILEIWQWGIVDRDLVELVTSLGFRLTYWEAAGVFFGNHVHCPAFRDHGYLFERSVS